MRQPDLGAAASGPRADRSSSTASVPLRVVAERLSVEEARAADEAERARRASLSLAGSVTRTVALAQQTAGHTARAVVSTAFPAAPGTVAPLADGSGSPVAAPGLPVVAPLPGRRGALGRLWALLSGRRRAGRHRPDELMRSWSMCSPQRRRSRRRVGR